MNMPHSQNCFVCRETATNYFGYRTDAQNLIFTEDARVFGKRAKIKGQRYDLIILDAFNGDYIPEHLMTVEYLQEMRDLLTPDGTLVANTFSSSNLYHHESNSYRQVFGDFINYRRQDTGNRVILIPQAQRDSDTRKPLSEELLLDSARARSGFASLRCADCAHCGRSSDRR